MDVRKDILLLFSFLFKVSYKGTFAQWIPFGSDYEYHFETRLPLQPAKWATAREACLFSGAELVSMHSQEEAEWLQQQIDANPEAVRYWIGLNRLDYQDEYKWSDGTPLDFTNWAASYPRTSNTHDLLCVNFGQYFMRAQWQNINCGEEMAYICKRPQNLTNVEPITIPPTTAAGGYCPAGYSGFGDSNKCFKVIPSSEQKVTYEDAIIECRQGPGFAPHMASISNELENNVVLALASEAGAREHLWIGYYEEYLHYYWLWSDGSPASYTKWAPGQPSLSGIGVRGLIDATYHLTDSGLWMSVYNSNQLGFVCETFKDPTSVINTPEPTKEPPGCLDDYIQYGAACYRLITTRGTWQDSEDQCIRQGGHLASIDSPYQNAFIASLTADSTDHVWIGLKDEGHAGSYNWSDSWPVIYTNWGWNQPDPPTNGGCVQMSMIDFKWYDTNCNTNYPKICKIDLAALPTLPAPPDGGTCPDQWLPFGDHCYYFQTRTLSWYWAQEECVRMNIRAHLVTIHSYDENDFVYRKMTDLAPRPDLYQYWIGMYKSRENKDYEWIDGEPVSYINWAPGEPNDIDDDSICVFMHDFGDIYDTLWGDRSCTNAGYSICKMRKLHIPVEPTGSGICYDGWHAFGNQCYLFNPDHFATWTTAQSDCVALGGHLATVDDAVINYYMHTEMVAMTRLPDLRSYWIGLERTSTEQIYRWVDTGAAANYTNWASGYPQYDNNQCVEVESQYESRWKDTVCTAVNGYVCQAPQRTLEPSNSGLSSGQAVGIAFGVIAAVLLLAAVGFYGYSRYGNPFSSLGGGTGNKSVLFQNEIDNPVHNNISQVETYPTAGASEA